MIQEFNGESVTAVGTDKLGIGSQDAVFIPNENIDDVIYFLQQRYEEYRRLCRQNCIGPSCWDFVEFCEENLLKQKNG